MTCDACARAELDPRTGHYSRGCRECDTRALAHSMDYHGAQAQGSLTPRYRRALALVMRGGESIADAHARVKGWARRMDES